MTSRDLKEARRPVVPDYRAVTTPAGRAALNKIMDLGWGGEHFDRLTLEAVSLLAIILRLYAANGRPPSTAEIAAETGGCVEQALQELQASDLVLLNSSGAICGAYPFTEQETVHQVALGLDRTLNAMCAIDALGAGAMCGEDSVVLSSCAGCKGSIQVQTSNRGEIVRSVVPQDALVWIGFQSSCGCAAETLCPNIQFFCSEAHLDRWSQPGPEAGSRLAVDEALEVGRALFGDRALLGRFLNSPVTALPPSLPFRPSTR